MKASEILALVRPNIAALTPYSTARDEYQGPLGIFLDANESPYPTGFNRYPDPHQKALKQRIAAIKGVRTENLFIGNGSDEAIDLVFRVFCRPGEDNAVAIAPSYGMYKVAAAINDVALREVQLNDDFSLPAERLMAACDADTRLMFLCSPNNPTGNAFSNDALIGLAERFRGMLVVDEAYIDFSSVPSLRARIADHPNIIVLQTLSKAWGMAALRVGLAFADPLVITLMSQVKYPYNIGQKTQETVLEALSSPIDARVRETVSERGRVEAALRGMSIVRKVWPSEANFLLVEFPDADAMYERLLEAGIIVRNRSRVPGCAGCLRITIGTPEENDRLIETLKQSKP